MQCCIKVYKRNDASAQSFNEQVARWEEKRLDGDDRNVERAVSFHRRMYDTAVAKFEFMTVMNIEQLGVKTDGYSRVRCAFLYLASMRR